jgi:hypothetical protein
MNAVFSASLQAKPRVDQLVARKTVTASEVSNSIRNALSSFADADRACAPLNRVAQRAV